MSTIQKWLGLMTGLGAGYLVLTNPKGFASLASGTKTIVGGTITTITTGGKR